MGKLFFEPDEIRPGSKKNDLFLLSPEYEMSPVARHYVDGVCMRNFANWIDYRDA